MIDKLLREQLHHNTSFTCRVPQTRTNMNCKLCDYGSTHLYNGSVHHIGNSLDFPRDRRLMSGCIETTIVLWKVLNVDI